MAALTVAAVASWSALPAGTPSASAAAAKPALTVTPIAVIPGGMAVAKGTAFPSGSAVTITVPIKLTTGATQTVKAAATADGKGNFKATLHIPNAAGGGKFTVTAKAAGGQTVTATLTIAVLKPSIVVVPTEAVPGTPITVNGFGFSAGAKVTITLAGQTLGTATTDSSGRFKATFTVPANLATSMYTLKAMASGGRQAAINVRVFRQIATHFYFASVYTGHSYHESLVFINTTAIQAQVHITYQRTSGQPLTKTVAVPAHARFTENVNNDIGANVSASAVVATDVPIAAERMVFYRADGAIDPGTTNPSNVWYFTNGNTTHFYHEYIAIQNPSNAQVQVTVHLYPTHSAPRAITRTMPAQSRTTVNVNQYVHDAVGIVVTSNGPVVANRTEYIHNGISSKTGVTGPETHWYFASGQRSNENGYWNRHWIGVVNTTGNWSHLMLHAYGAGGLELGTVSRMLRPYAREGFLMNQVAGQRDVAVAVTTSEPSIVEQLTFLNYNHAQNTDSYGVTVPGTSAQFANATTWPGQDNLLSIFNPNLTPIPVVVQYLNTRGGTTQQTYVIAPFAHVMIDVGKVLPNAQLGLLVASNDPFVALDRQVIFNGSGAMTTVGTQK
jgi:hypothetical protein